jgi:hypothetical protein
MTDYRVIYHRNRVVSVNGKRVGEVHWTGQYTFHPDGDAKLVHNTRRNGLDDAAIATFKRKFEI